MVAVATRSPSQRSQCPHQTKISTVMLTPLTLIYAENGRGKTMLAAILRSLSTGESALIES